MQLSRCHALANLGPDEPFLLLYGAITLGIIVKLLLLELIYECGLD